MELGRELLRLWGYTRVDELIWVKTNQLQRLIRTGRTGHWLNHGKEHCLVGIKGQPKNLNRGLDCDVLGKCSLRYFFLIKPDLKREFWKTLGKLPKCEILLINLTKYMELLNGYRRALEN